MRRKRLAGTPGLKRVFYPDQQGGLLSALGSLALMLWLASTPHSPQTESKRLAILAGFAFLTGMTTITTITTITIMTMMTMMMNIKHFNKCHDCSSSPGLGLGPTMDFVIAVNPR